MVARGFLFLGPDSGPFLGPGFGLIVGSRVAVADRSALPLCCALRQRKKRYGLCACVSSFTILRVSVIAHAHAFAAEPVAAAITLAHAGFTNLFALLTWMSACYARCPNISDEFVTVWPVAVAYDTVARGLLDALKLSKIRCTNLYSRGRSHTVRNFACRFLTRTIVNTVL